MTVINTRIIVAPDGAISTTTPLAASEYIARIGIPEPPHPASDSALDDLPVHDLGPWPEALACAARTCTATTGGERHQRPRPVHDLGRA